MAVDLYTLTMRSPGGGTEHVDPCLLSSVRRTRRALRAEPDGAVGTVWFGPRVVARWRKVGGAVVSDGPELLSTLPTGARAAFLEALDTCEDEDPEGLLAAVLTAVWHDGRRAISTLTLDPSPEKP